MPLSLAGLWDLDIAGKCSLATWRATPLYLLHVLLALTPFCAYYLLTTYLLLTLSELAPGSASPLALASFCLVRTLIGLGVGLGLRFGFGLGLGLGLGSGLVGG